MKGTYKFFSGGWNGGICKSAILYKKQRFNKKKKIIFTTASLLIGIFCAFLKFTVRNPLGMPVRKRTYISKALCFWDWPLLIVLRLQMNSADARRHRKTSCARNSICSLLYELDSKAVRLESRHRWRLLPWYHFILPLYTNKKCTTDFEWRTYAHVLGANLPVGSLCWGRARPLDSGIQSSKIKSPEKE